jgi:hypothetical protein
MPKPIKRRELIRRMRQFGWIGPEAGKRHAVMRKGEHTVPIPNPHGGDIDWSLTKRILDQAEISREDWDATE